MVVAEEEENNDDKGEKENNKAATTPPPPPEIIDPLPTLRHRDYMVSTDTVQCRFFNTPNGCVYGPKCTSAHVYYPTPTCTTALLQNETDVREYDVIPAKEALQIAYHVNFQIEITNKSDSSSPNINQDYAHFCNITMLDSINKTKQWHTAAWLCPKENVIYYAYGGRYGQVSLQGIYWYPSEKDAKLAVSAVVLQSFEERGLIVGEWKKKVKKKAKKA